LTEEKFATLVNTRLLPVNQQRIAIEDEAVKVRPRAG
jgi:hypothetical protein